MKKVSTCLSGKLNFQAATKIASILPSNQTIELRFYLQMRRYITKDQSIYHCCYFPIDIKGQMRRFIIKDQSIYHFCYFPIDLKDWAIGNKSHNTDTLTGKC